LAYFIFLLSATKHPAHLLLYSYGSEIAHQRTTETPYKKGKTKMNTKRNAKSTFAALCALTASVAPQLTRTVAIGAVVAGSLIATTQPAHAQLGYGWYEMGNNSQLAVMNGADARKYADTLAGTSAFQDRVNKIAEILIKYGTGNNRALQLARLICYNGLGYFMKARIYWCSYQSNRVYIYHKYYLPFYADPA
jgi:hypothetical protein